MRAEKKKKLSLRRAPMIGRLLKTKQNSSKQPGSALAPGALAPDFTLPSSSGETISLRDFRGQPVVLVFYPADWSPVCGDQVVLYNEILPIFEEYKAQVLGISVDGVWSHKAFAEARNLDFPLLADFEPKGAVARVYGVYREKDGTSQRALFVIDAEGIIRWSYVSPIDVNPGANGILAALEGLPTKDPKGARTHGSP
jgi:peroxiredoxin